MIMGIGMDVVEIERIRHAAESRDSFLNRVYTSEERSHCEHRADPYPHLAARFAAKEAVFKAFGTGWARGLRWTDVAVENNAAGRPSVRLDGVARRMAREMGVDRIHLSITHTERYAGAQVVMEGP